MEIVSFWPMLMTQYSGRKQIQYRKNAESLLDISKEVGLEVNPEKTKYIYVSVKVSEGRTEAEHKDRE
jgi:hypothetical protein